MARAGPPRVGRWGDSPESPPRAPPWWRCKVCHLSEGKRVTWGLPPETRPRAAAEGGGGDVSCHYASGSAAALLSQFCPNFVFFLIVMIGKSVPLTACEATACCCGFALPLGRVIGVACPGGQEKVPLDSRKEKHEHSHNMFVSGHLPPTVGLRESPSREEGGFTSASESNSAPARLPSGAGPRARRAPLEARATETGRAVHAAHPLPCGHVRVMNTAKYPTM